MKLLISVGMLLTIASTSFGWSMSCDYPCYVREFDILVMLRPPSRPYGMPYEGDIEKIQEMCDSWKGTMLPKKCPQLPPPGAR